jgi:hypothetical protein
MRADIEQRIATEAELRADIEQRIATEAELRADITRRETTEATLRAQLDVLRSKLVDAERRWYESEVAIAALKAQMSSMRRQLDAAREVGAAILEALRHDIGTPPNVAHNSAWQALLLQHVKLRARGQLLFDPAVLGRGSR